MELESVGHDHLAEHQELDPSHSHSQSQIKDDDTTSDTKDSEDQDVDHIPKDSEEEEAQTQTIIRTYSVDEAIDIIGVGSYFGIGWFQFRLLFMTGAVWAADAMEMMLLSFLLPTLRKEWGLEDYEVSFVGAIVFFGMLIGGSFLSLLADCVGRKRVVIVANAGCAACGLLSGIAPDLTAMLIIRFLVGVFIGGGSVGYTLFAEYIPTAKRGKLLVYVHSVCAL